MKEAREYVDHHYERIQGLQQRQSTGVWIVAKFSVRDYSVYIYLLNGPLHLPILALKSRPAPDVASAAPSTLEITLGLDISLCYLFHFAVQRDCGSVDSCQNIVLGHDRW